MSASQPLTHDKAEVAQSFVAIPEPQVILAIVDRVSQRCDYLNPSMCIHDHWGQALYGHSRFAGKLIDKPVKEVFDSLCTLNRLSLRGGVA